VYAREKRKQIEGSNVEKASKIEQHEGRHIPRNSDTQQFKLKIEKEQ